MGLMNWIKNYISSIKYKNADIRYTVRYLDRENNSSIAPEKTVSGLAYGVHIVERPLDLFGYSSLDLVSRQIQMLSVSLD